MVKKSLQAVKNNIWKTVTVVITIFSLIGGVWAMEDRYVKKEEVVPIAIAQTNLQKQQESFQKQQQAFKSQQEMDLMKSKIAIIKAKLEFYNLIKDDLTKEINDAKRWSDAHPEDRVLQERVVNLQKSRDKVNERIRELMKELP